MLKWTLSPVKRRFAENFAGSDGRNAIGWLVSIGKREADDRCWWSL